MSSHQELLLILESPNQVSSILDASRRDGGLDGAQGVMGMRQARDVTWLGQLQTM